jgi:hypothetical protein
MQNAEAVDGVDCAERTIRVSSIRQTRSFKSKWTWASIGRLGSAKGVYARN